MPNHVHLILNPADASGLALALSRAHRLYAGFVNARARQTGHLFQGRYGSAAMDEDHLMAAARYVALNPVRGAARGSGAGLAVVERAGASGGPRRRLVSVRPLLDRAPRFADLIAGEPDDAAFTPLRRAELIGRPIGAPDFLETIARRLGRAVTPARRGRKPRNAGVEGSKQGKTGVSP